MRNNMADRLDKIENRLHEVICVLAKLEGFLMHRRCSCKYTKEDRLQESKDCCMIKDSSQIRKAE